LTKVDLLSASIARRIVQAGNSIGGAISDDGELIAVSNYEPGGVRVFDAQTLDPVASIPATGADGKASKALGLVDLPGRRFAFALYDAGEIWVADLSATEAPVVTKLTGVGKLPYDGNVTPDGRHYLAGLFGEDGVVHVDTWQSPLKVERILDGYGRGEQALPVYKMPHLEGWAAVGDRLLLPAVGHHELIAVDLRNFAEAGRVATYGQPVFAVARPDGRHVWVNFAHPLNDTIDVVDTESLKVIRRFAPGPAVLHMEFTPRGNEVWVSVRDADRVDVYDAATFAKKAEIAAQKPSGIFFTVRATRIGQ
jgi:protein NirF